jgi:hypothetical protein
VYRSIIHHNNPIAVRITLTEARQKLMFDEGVECFGVDRSSIDSTGDVAVHRYGRKDTEVFTSLQVHRIWDNSTFGTPSMCPCPSGRIDPGFVKENNLFGTPVGDLAHPGIPEHLVSLCGFFGKLPSVTTSTNEPFYVRSQDLRGYHSTALH